MNWEKLKQTLGVTPKIVEEPKKLSPEEERKAVMAKEKEEATAKGEPWVGVLAVSYTHLTLPTTPYV